jgi:preprotein translocase subunit YajC
MKKRLFPLMMLAMSLLGSIGVFANEGGDSGANTGGMGSWWIWIIIYGGMFAIFYFLLIRPNKKKQKAEEELRNNITLGDEITTIGGICGRVVSIKDEEITLESSIDRTLIQFKKWAVRDVKKLETDDEPAAAIEDKKEEKKKKEK